MSNKLQFTSSVGKTSPKRLGLVLQFFSYTVYYMGKRVKFPRKYRSKHALSPFTIFGVRISLLW